MWNDLPYTVFDTGTLDRFKGAVNRLLQHDVDDTTTRNSGQGKAWPLNTPGAQEAEGDIQQLTPTPTNNTQGLGEQIATN